MNQISISTRILKSSTESFFCWEFFELWGFLVSLRVFGLGDFRLVGGFVKVENLVGDSIWFTYKKGYSMVFEFVGCGLWNFDLMSFGS